jgi:hypothetical protein
LLFAYIQLRVRHPLLDLRVLSDRNFVISLVVIGVMFTGMFLVLGDVPAFLLATQQLTLTNAGLVMVPQALTWILSIPVAGLLQRLFDGRWQATAGLLLLGGGTIALTRLDVDIPRSLLAPLLCVRALGLGLVLVPLLGGGVATIATRLMPDGLTIRLIAQRVVSGIGVGAFSALATHRRVQVFSDSAALLTPDAVASDPRLTALQGRGPGALALLYQSAQARSLTQAYSDIFLVSGSATLLCIGLLLFIRRAEMSTSTDGQEHDAPSPIAVHQNHRAAAIAATPRETPQAPTAPVT